jgi:quinol monooxygenase YgiN
VFTRIVELTAARGKARELSNTLQDRALPIMQGLPGFVDAALLVSEAEPDRLVALSNWKTKEDAERYHREHYPNIHRTLERLLDGQPVIRTFDVYLSTSHKISASKAA